MRTFIPAAFALLAAVPAGAAERRYPVTDFDRVQIEGPYEVTLSTGRPSAAAASGSQPALDRVSIEVQGGTLRIRPNRSAWGGTYPGGSVGPVRVAIATRNLRSATLLGSASLAVDKASGLRLDLSVSGSGSLGIASLAVDNLVVGLVGSGKVTLAGKAKQFRATVQGSAGLDAAGLRANDANVVADTAGLVAVGASRTARVKATGSGNVEIIGAPACTVEALGAGIVSCGSQR